ncbi:MAG: restriction endonuclease subunit S [Colwellia polaris]|jgi:type I restriction enzyme S subunit
MALDTKLVKIKDLGTVITGGTPPTKQREYYGSVIPLIKPTDMVIGQRYIGDTEESLSEIGVKKFKNKLVPANTPCVVTIGTIGKSCLTKEISLVNQAVNCVVVNTVKYDIMYVYYLMQLTIPTVKSLNSGTASGRENVSKSVFENIDVRVVKDKKQQEVIGKQLSEYDSLIENNNRRIAILEDMAQSLYREWFVNFRYPDNANGNQKLIDSPLGQTPEGWEVRPLIELVNFKRNTIKKGNVPDKTPYMGLEHFPRKSIALSEWEKVSEIGSNKLAFNRGDILFGKIRPNFHKVGVAQVDGLCSSDAFVLSPKNAAHHALIAMVTFSNEFVAQAVQTSQGSKMPRASWDVLKEFSVPVPAQYIIEKFNAVVDPAIKQIRVLSLKNRNLKQQRDMLLPKLISGKINLNEAN